MASRKSSPKDKTDSPPNEETFRLLFANHPVPMWVYDLKTLAFLEVNEAAVEKYGYSRDEFLALTIKDIRPAEEVERLLKNVKQKRPVIQHSREWRHQFKNGEIIDVEITSHMLEFEGHKAALVMAQDINERVQAEEKIRQLNAELEKRVDERTRELHEAQEQLVRQEKLAVLGQMASSVGHELRNPLGVINSAVYYIKLVQPDADAKIKEYLGIIEQEIRTSERIITDLLDFARIKSVDREPVSVSDLIRQTLERFPAPPAVEVVLDLPADLPRVYADPRQMTQVLSNLIVNACQAMVSTGSTGTPEGGKLSLYGNVQNDMINIIVKDTGVGIPPENMKKLFEPLFTTKSRGIGLGLAVSKKLTEANGGRIEVQSEAGQGSSFTVWLPVQK